MFPNLVPLREAIEKRIKSLVQNGPFISFGMKKLEKKTAKEFKFHSNY